MTKANEYELQEGDTIRDWMGDKEVVWLVLGSFGKYPRSDGRPMRMTRLQRQDTGTALALSPWGLANLFENLKGANGRS